MIRLVLIDLDDTLIQTDTYAFTARYLGALAEFAAEIVSPDSFIPAMVTSYSEALDSAETTKTLYDRLLSAFSGKVDVPRVQLEPVFTRFYNQIYPELAKSIKPMPGADKLLAYFSEQGIPVVIATNPALPLAATRQRMASGGLDTSDTQFSMITTLDIMRFGKPQPDYYTEIVLHFDAEPSQTIMIGDEWDNDIVAAAAAGIHTYWVTDGNDAPPAPGVARAYGGLQNLLGLLEANWLDSLTSQPITRQILLSRLKVFPAVVSSLCARFSQSILECIPGEGEWSVRDIVCHLRDHELDDRQKLCRVLGENNPFLSANLNPWAEGAAYRTVTLQNAQEAFAAERDCTVGWLESLTDEQWNRPARDAIFGPTRFAEIVAFMAEHDRTHYRQMNEAIEIATGNCG